MLWSTFPVAPFLRVWIGFGFPAQPISVYLRNLRSTSIASFVSLARGQKSGVRSRQPQMTLTDADITRARTSRQGREGREDQGTAEYAEYAEGDNLRRPIMNSPKRTSSPSAYICVYLRNLRSTSVASFAAVESLRFTRPSFICRDTAEAWRRGSPDSRPPSPVPARSSFPAPAPSSFGNRPRNRRTSPKWGDQGTPGQSRRSPR